jgi:hypothetical protein
MIEGVTLPVDEETMNTGAPLSEPRETLQEQRATTENEVTGKPHEKPKVSTDPDESTSYGIAYSYGRNGPT